MSEHDSFIHEVSEEFRRDKLFAVFKKYGWILGLAIAVVIGAAGFSEWRKAKESAAAEATGDAMLAALEMPDRAATAAALDALAAGGTGEASIIARFQQAASLQQAGATADAVKVLEAIAAEPGLRRQYVEMAQLKALMLDNGAKPAADRIAALSALSEPGRPYRLLALEQRALVYVETGDREAALADLSVVFQSAEATRGMQQRVGQLIVALGGELPQAEPVLVQ